MKYTQAYNFGQHTLRACLIPPETQLDYSWILRKISLEEQVGFLTYSTASETYVLSSSSSVGFKLPENDELHPEWRDEGLLPAQYGKFSFPNSIPSENIPT
jgi:cleavage and polyadenylation specificity factor subunit 1